MPIIQSAKKQLRQNKKKKARNDNFKALFVEARKAFDKAIKEGDAKAAREILVNKTDKDWKTIRAWLQSIIDKLDKKNIIHSNNASRKKSKYVRMLKTLEAKS